MIDAVCFGIIPKKLKVEIPDAITEKDRILMARYTPNFDKEIWKYHAGEILGFEFNWRK